MLCNGCRHAILLPALLHQMITDLSTTWHFILTRKLDAHNCIFYNMHIYFYKVLVHSKHVVNVPLVYVACFNKFFPTFFVGGVFVKHAKYPSAGFWCYWTHSFSSAFAE